MESEEMIFLEILDRITDLIPEIKTKDIFNNQFIRSNGSGHDGRKENIPVYPCCFIQILPEEISDMLRGVQKTTYTIRFHIGDWSEKDTDFNLFVLKKKLYKAFHKWKPSKNNNWNSLLRRAENISYDNDNVNIYIMDFTTMNTDYDADTLGNPMLVNVSLQQVITLTQSQIGF